ncbi:MAG: M14 family metallocarboxypeptidase [Firmicutes bacterium]|nr:M14 family metallocarboxypeptidase [Bacillota bacterium]
MYVPTTKPLTSKLLRQTIYTLLTYYPIINHWVIGRSRMGSPVYALTIGHGEKHVLINAAHHANEWITSVIAMKFLEDCASSAKSEHEWINRTTLHIVPMVNPDGVDLVTGGLNNSHAAYRKARLMAGEEPFPDGWKANIAGVDLNSNYPASWEQAKHDKFERGYTKPGPRDYVGMFPLCEPETAAMAAYTMAKKFVYTVSLHTQGEVIYWQYQDYSPPGAEELAKRLSAAAGYALEDVPDVSSHAGYRDWFIETFNRPGFTVECGLGENPLPLSDFESIYKKTAPLLWEVI